MGLTAAKSTFSSALRRAVLRIQLALRIQRTYAGALVYVPSLRALHYAMPWTPLQSP